MPSNYFITCTHRTLLMNLSKLSISHASRSLKQGFLSLQHCMLQTMKVGGCSIQCCNGYKVPYMSKNHFQQCGCNTSSWCIETYTTTSKFNKCLGSSNMEQSVVSFVVGQMKYITFLTSLVLYTIQYRTYYIS